LRCEFLPLRESAGDDIDETAPTRPLASTWSFQPWTAQPKCTAP